MSKNNNLSPKLIFIFITASILILPFQLSCKSTNISQITQSINPRVVQIVLVVQQTEGELSSNIIPVGTGLLLNNDGYVITASHLIDIAELYVQQNQTKTMKLGIIIPPPDVVLNNQSVLQVSTNDFEVISTDREHDLALLRLKISKTISPFNGETLSEIHFSNGASGTLNLGDARFGKNISNNISVSITGYPSTQLVLDTKTGKVTSPEIIGIISPRISLETSYVTFQLENYFQSDIISTQGLSGSPVYSPRNGEIMGICINISDSSKETAIIPSRYILTLLKDNNINIK